ncbi:hypothetical protein NMY22_g8596 [Coprinellus aureogranulatus]|nr:hypothetical protein NMY22_g8596 [Coprinellus aureogranulatus]
MTTRSLPPFWSLAVVPGQHRPVTEVSSIVVVSACLQEQLPPGEHGRGSLSLRVGLSGRAKSIASFARDTWEYVELNLVLEGGVEYVFGVEGPFTVDLIGYYLPDHQLHKSNVSSPSASSKSSKVINQVQRADEVEAEDELLAKAQRNGGKKRKAHHDDEQPAEEPKYRLSKKQERCISDDSESEDED